MAYPIEAYYGRKTYAMLDGCCICGKPYQDKPYQDDVSWHTLQSSKDKTDTWLLACDECYAKLEESED